MSNIQLRGCDIEILSDQMKSYGEGQIKLMLDRTLVGYLNIWKKPWQEINGVGFMPNFDFYLYQNKSCSGLEAMNLIEPVRVITFGPQPTEEDQRTAILNCLNVAMLTTGLSIS